MNYIIFDLEATCWKDRNHGGNETIEIGAVKIDADGTAIDEFQTFVKPLRHPTLSEFCTELTSIQQSDVDSAPLFLEAISSFKIWVGEGKESYLLCSWGFYDRKQLKEDSNLSNLDSDWLKYHISVKHQHHKLAATKRPLGMATALEAEGFSLDGTHHRGIDDARNIGKIFRKYFGQWKY
jgi:3'-5' exoribonuclease 1